MKDLTKWNKNTRNNPYKVPEGYFEDFEGRMMDLISEKSETVQKRLIPYGVIRWVSGVAAVLLIGFIGINQFYLKPQKNLLDQEAMFTVIEYFAQSMDDTYITELLAENDVLAFDESTDEDLDLLEWMDVDELSIIDAMIEVAY